MLPLPACILAPLACLGDDLRARIADGRPEGLALANALPFRAALYLVVYQVVSRFALQPFPLIGQYVGFGERMREIAFESDLGLTARTGRVSRATRGDRTRVRTPGHCRLAPRAP